MKTKKIKKDTPEKIVNYIELLLKGYARKDSKLYRATIKVLGKTYEASGATISEAIANLKPDNCKGRCIITMQKDDVIRDKILTNMTAHRLFNSQGLTREIALKNTSLMFQGI